MAIAYVRVSTETLTVRRSHGRDIVKGGVERVLPLHPTPASLLRAAIDATDCAWVCPAEGGEQMGEHYDLEGRLRRLMSEAGLGEGRRLGFHDLRRSHASLLAEAGVSTAIAQKLMRHSDPKLTQDVYAQVDLATFRREVGRLPRVPHVSPRRGHRNPRRLRSAKKISTYSYLYSSG